MLRPRKYPSYRVVHLTPYHKGDSPAAIRYAVKHDYAAVDLNFLVTKDDRIVCTHWSQPMKHGFYDPLKRLNPNLRVHEMTWAQVARLRTADGYRIHSAAAMMRLTARAGIRLEFEAKNSPYFIGTRGVNNFKAVKALATRYKLRITVKTLSNLPGADKRLGAAKKAGLTTLILPRGTRRLKKSVYWPVTDYVRGAVWWV